MAATMLDECCCIEITCSYCKSLPGGNRRGNNGTTGNTTIPENPSNETMGRRGLINGTRRSSSVDMIPTRDPDSPRINSTNFNRILDRLSKNEITTSVSGLLALRSDKSSERSKGLGGQRRSRSEDRFGTSSDVNSRIKGHTKERSRKDRSSPGRHRYGKNSKNDSNNNNGMSRTEDIPGSVPMVGNVHNYRGNLGASSSQHGSTIPSQPRITYSETLSDCRSRLARWALYNNIDMSRTGRDSSFKYVRNKVWGVPIDTWISRRLRDPANSSTVHSAEARYSTGQFTRSHSAKRFTGKFKTSPDHSRETDNRSYILSSHRRSSHGSHPISGFDLLPQKPKISVRSSSAKTMNRHLTTQGKTDTKSKRCTSLTRTSGFRFENNSDIIRPTSLDDRIINQRSFLSNANNKSNMKDKSNSKKKNSERGSLIGTSACQSSAYDKINWDPSHGNGSVFSTDNTRTYRAGKLHTRSRSLDQLKHYYDLHVDRRGRNVSPGISRRARDNLNFLDQLDFNTKHRGRAKETFHEVHRHLQKEPISRRRKRRSRSAGSRAYHEHSDYTYGAAVDRLRDLLDKHDASPHRKTVQFSPRASDRYYGSPGHPSATTDATYHPSRSLPLPARGEVPNADEAVRLLQNQSVVIQQMEAENRFCKSELVELKTKVKSVMEENRSLHEALKRSVVEEILQQDMDVPGVPTQLPDASHGRHVTAPGGATERPMTVQDYGKWQRELERITTLHTAKSTRLEAQLAHAKEEGGKYEEECEALRAKLRMSESLGAVGQNVGHLAMSYGLCIKCSQNEAVTPATLTNQQATVDRITKERDELMDQLTSMKSSIEEMKQREDDAYSQVKKSVEMVEQAQLEQTQALVQREQLKEELLNMRKRMEEHVEEMQEKMTSEREMARAESKAERDELNQKLKEMTEKLVDTEVQLDKMARDKVTLMAELEAARGEISLFDTDYNKATDTMKMSMTHATVERNAAITELQRSKTSMDHYQKEADYKITQLKVEVKDLRRRLAQAENDLLNSKEYCIHLTTEVQTLERETHLAKLAKESIEKNRSDDVKAITQRADTREEELNMLIETLENKHGQTTSELDEIIRTQNGLVLKLRDECRSLARQLEKLTIKYKGDNKHLASVNSALKVSLDKSRKHVVDLERQNHQHAQLADKMRQRLRQMDDHAKRGSGQILELLARESSLIRDRQLLAKEIEFLKREATSLNDSDLDKIFATRSEMIEDILKNVQNEETAHRKTLKEKSSAVLIETDRGMQTDDL